MFIHLGGNHMISVNEVIAIIDATSKEDSLMTHPFFMRAKQNGWMEKIEGGTTKSFVVTDYKIYASPISSLTLKKRAAIEKHIPASLDKKRRK